MTKNQDKVLQCTKKPIQTIPVKPGGFPMGKPSNDLTCPL